MSDRQLELRAQQLASARLRWDLAEAVRGVVAQAERTSAAPTLIPFLLVPLAPPSGPATPTPASVREALLDLADALTDPGCTSVQGIAQASWLLCDAGSPLYARLPARTLQRIARDTIAALHGET